jgi:hypothetical protein
MVNQSSELKEFRETGHQPQNPAIRLAARAISMFFIHYCTSIYCVVPYYGSTLSFASFTPAEKVIALLGLLSCIVFPLVTVLLAKGLGFIDSIYLKTQKERIIPYIAWYLLFWMCYVLRNQPSFKEVVLLSMAIFIASSIGLLVNIYMKVSMHSISMGVSLPLCHCWLLLGSNYTVYMVVVFLLAGLYVQPVL